MQISEGVSHSFKIFPRAKSFHCLPRSIRNLFDLHNLTICSLTASGYQKVVQQYFSNSGILRTCCFYDFRQYDSAKFLLRITGEIYRHFIFRSGNLKCHTGMFLLVCLAAFGRKNSLISNEKPRIRAFSFEKTLLEVDQNGNAYTSYQCGRSTMAENESK